MPCADEVTVVRLRRLILRVRQDAEVGLQVAQLVHDEQHVEVEQRAVRIEHVGKLRRCRHIAVGAVQIVHLPVEDMRVVFNQRKIVVVEVDYTLAVQGQLDFALIVECGNLLPGSSQNREVVVHRGEQTHAVFLIIDTIVVQIVADLLHHRGEFLQRPLIVPHKLIRVVHPVHLDHFLIENQRMRAAVVAEGDVARGVVHSAADGEVGIGALIPIILLQVDVGRIVQILQDALVGEVCHIVGAYHGGIVDIVAGHIVGVQLGKAGAAAHCGGVRHDILVGNVHAVVVGKIAVAAENGTVHCGAVLAVRLIVIPCPVAGNEKAEVARKRKRGCVGQIGGVFRRLRCRCHRRIRHAFCGRVTAAGDERRAEPGA